MFSGLFEAKTFLFLVIFIWLSVKCTGQLHVFDGTNDDFMNEQHSEALEILI